MKYPDHFKSSITDNYHGTTINDPYRYLEDENDEKTVEFVRLQNIITNEYFKSIPYRDNIKSRLTQIWNFERISNPVKRNNVVIFSKNNGLNDQSVIYIKNDDNTEEVLLDPGKENFKGKFSIMEYELSPDGDYLAYTLSDGGSDWREIRIRSVNLKNDLPDQLKNIKFSQISWYGKGFYYSRYKDNPKIGSTKNQYHQVYFHEIGTPQGKDILIYDDYQHAERNFYANVTGDLRYLTISIFEGTHNNALVIKNLQDNKAEFIPISNHFSYEYSVVGTDKEKLIILTNEDAPNYKLIAVDVNDNKSSEILAESENVIHEAISTKNYLILTYIEKASHKVKLFNLKGQFLTIIDLPEFCTIEKMDSDFESDEIFVTYSSFLTPSKTVHVNLCTNQMEVFAESEIQINTKNYVVKQEYFRSKDGEHVSMFIVHKKNIKYDSCNHIMLYGYGGFNISITPSFDISRLFWLENNGVYASVNLRGGGEYGTKWHESGKKFNKQNVFDDYIYAAEYLIDKGYTSAGKIVGVGRSNGGLLIGAVANQCPDLFGAMIPAVGVMDMLRYDKFTIGWAWKSEYGSTEDPAEFQNLLRYSPLHNISEQTAYPAIFVMTANRDDRVVPAHSYKYIATLQEKYTGDRPLIIRIGSNSGHGAGTPVNKAIEEKTDMYTFIWKNLDIPLYF